MFIPPASSIHDQRQDACNQDLDLSSCLENFCAKPEKMHAGGENTAIQEKVMLPTHANDDFPPAGQGSRQLSSILLEVNIAPKFLLHSQSPAFSLGQ